MRWPPDWPPMEAPRVNDSDLLCLASRGDDIVVKFDPPITKLAPDAMIVPVTHAGKRRMLRLPYYLVLGLSALGFAHSMKCIQGNWHIFWSNTLQYYLIRPL